MPRRGLAPPSPSPWREKRNPRPHTAILSPSKTPSPRNRGIKTRTRAQSGGGASCWRRGSTPTARCSDSTELTPARAPPTSDAAAGCSSGDAATLPRAPRPASSGFSTRVSATSPAPPFLLATVARNDGHGQREPAASSRHLASAQLSHLLATTTASPAPHSLLNRSGRPGRICAILCSSSTQIRCSPG